MPEEKFSLKDHLFNAPKVAFLAQAIADVYAPFDKGVFEHGTVLTSFHFQLL